MTPFQTITSLSIDQCLFELRRDSVWYLILRQLADGNELV